MRRQIVASQRAGETVTRIAERLLDADEAIVRLPQHVTDLRDAARMALEQGDRNLYEEAVQRWRSRINRLGQGAAREAGEFTMRSATQQLVKELREARDVGQVDEIVNRWTLDRARYQARVIARTEAIEAYRESYMRQMDAQPSTVGYRWTLSNAHPRPDVCFPAGTMVETDRGPVPIEEVSEGDLVLTHERRYRPVRRALRTTPAGGLLRLRFQAGPNRVHEVAATPNHPFATAQGWTRADALRIGDECLALDDAPSRPSCRRCGDTIRTDRSGSPRSAPSGHRRTNDAARCAEPRSQAPRTDTSDAALASTPTRPSESGRPRSPRNRPSIPDSPHPFGHATGARGSGQASPMPQDAAGRSSDSPRHDSRCPCSESSSSGRPSSSLAERTACRTSRTAEARADAPRGSNRSSRNGDASSERRMSRTGDEGTDEQPPRTHGRSTCGESNPGPPSPLRTWETLAPRTKHTASMSVLVEVAYDIATTPGTVFNLEVDEDHTYFANGILVHNCDVYAHQDLHGIGEGGYPPGEVPSTPHPLDMCSQVAIVDNHYFRREVARARGQEEPPREWESGTTQRGEDWLRTQPERTQRELLGPTRHQLFRHGVPVLRDDGTPIPVHELQGRPPPQRTAGPAVRVRGLVERDRASMQQPFPAAPTLPAGDTGRSR